MAVTYTGVKAKKSRRARRRTVLHPGKNKMSKLLTKAIHAQRQSLVSLNQAKRAIKKKKKKHPLADAGFFADLEAAYGT